MSKHVLVSWWHPLGVVGYAVPCVYIKLTWSVPYCGLLFGRLISFAFSGVQVQEFWTFHVFELPHYPHQFLHVVTVVWSEVSDVHALKHVLLMTDGRLESIAQSDESIASVVFKKSLIVHPCRHLKPQQIIGFICVEAQQILLHSSHASVYAHVIVVEDDEQVVGCG